MLDGEGDELEGFLVVRLGMRVGNGMGMMLGEEVEGPEVCGWFCFFLTCRKGLKKVLCNLLNYQSLLLVCVEALEVAEERRDAFGETLVEIFADGLFEFR